MKPDEKPVLIYTTFGSMEEARKVAREIVEARLAACANIIPSMVSVYEWEDEIQEASEIVVILKSVVSKVQMIFDRVKELHSYETPALLAIEPVQTDAGFAHWVAAQTRQTGA